MDAFNAQVEVTWKKSPDCPYYRACPDRMWSLEYRFSSGGSTMHFVHCCPYLLRRSEWESLMDGRPVKFCNISSDGHVVRFKIDTEGTDDDAVLSWRVPLASLVPSLRQAINAVEAEGLRFALEEDPSGAACHPVCPHEPACSEVRPEEPKRSEEPERSEGPERPEGPERSEKPECLGEPACSEKSPHASGPASPTNRRDTETASSLALQLESWLVADGMAREAHYEAQHAKRVADLTASADDLRKMVLSSTDPTRWEQTVEATLASLVRLRECRTSTTSDLHDPSLEVIRRLVYVGEFVCVPSSWLGDLPEGAPDGWCSSEDVSEGAPEGGLSRLGQLIRRGAVWWQSASVRFSCDVTMGGYKFRDVEDVEDEGDSLEFVPGTVGAGPWGDYLNFCEAVEAGDFDKARADAMDAADLGADDLYDQGEEWDSMMNGKAWVSFPVVLLWEPSPPVRPGRAPVGA